MKNMDEDIVYSVIERYSRKASEPTTTRSITTSSLILDYLRGTLVLLGSLCFLEIYDINEFFTMRFSLKIRLIGGINYVGKYNYTWQFIN